jgi:hypothetical protein
MEIEIELTDEQLAAAYKLSKTNGENGIVWWKVGEGKTRIALAWSLLVLDHDPRPLVICSPSAFRQWLDEIDLLGLDKYIKPVFQSFATLSYSGSLELDRERFNCLILDELWMYKNPKSTRSKRAKELTRRVPSIGLSGSLMTAGNLEDLYGQAKAMNIEEKIARSMTSFRTQFMVEAKNWAGFIDRYPKKGAVEAIQQRLYENVSVYFPKERRAIRDIPIHIEPTKQQLEVRKQLLKTWNYDTLEIKAAVSLIIKLLQVSDGFLRVSEGDYLPIKSSKISRLKELCTELFDAGEQQLLIWVGFRKTANILSEALPWKTTLLTGDGRFDVFGWRDGKIKITIATVGSGASLNDFTNIRYSIFYSSSFSALNVQQARGRTNRKSSLHKCAYYYFLSTNKFPDGTVYMGIEENRTKEQIVRNILNEVKKEKETKINSQTWDPE